MSKNITIILGALVLIGLLAGGGYLLVIDNSTAPQKQVKTNPNPSLEYEKQFWDKLSRDANN